MIGKENFISGKTYFLYPSASSGFPISNIGRNLESISCFNSCFTKRLFFIHSKELDLFPAWTVIKPPKLRIKLDVLTNSQQTRSYPLASISALVKLHVPWILVHILFKSAFSEKIPIKCIDSEPPNSEQNSIPGKT